MTRERPLSRRRVYDYLKLTAPVAADVTLLTVADRLSARGSGPTATPEMIEAHLELAREMLPAALVWHREGPPRSPIAGDELAAELGIEPGPELGRLLGELEAAVFTGEVVDAPRRRSRTLERANRLRARCSDCIFCAIVAGERPAEIVDSDEHTVAFMDINPATPGHALVIPRNHSADLLEIGDEDLARHDRGRPPAGAADGARRSSRTASTCSIPAARRPGRPSSTSTSTWCRAARTIRSSCPGCRARATRRRSRRRRADPGAEPKAKPTAPVSRRLIRARADGRPTITLERDGDVASIVLSNPPLNLFTDNAFNELMECLDEVEGSDARALVWRADGRDLHRRRRRERASSGSSTPGRASPRTRSPAR